MEERKDFWAVLFVPREMPTNDRERVISKLKELDDILKEVKDPNSISCIPSDVRENIYQELLKKACC